MYYRNANCAVVVYDITQTVGWHAKCSTMILTCIPVQQASLDKARTWIRELQRQADPSIVILLCGNKTDLEARRWVFASSKSVSWAFCAIERSCPSTSGCFPFKACSVLLISR